MKELLGQLRLATLEACRNDVARQLERSQTRPDPWSALRSMMKDGVTRPPPEGEVKGSAGQFLLEAATSRLLENLADARQQRDVATLRQVLKKRVDEAHLACALFRASTGSAGAAWDDLGTAGLERDGGSRDVRIGTLAIPSDDLRQVAPELDWEFSVPALLPLERATPVCIVAPGEVRAKAVAALESVALRRLLAAAPGALRLRILNPAGAYDAMGRCLPEGGVVACSASEIEKALDEVLQDLAGSGSGRSHEEMAGDIPVVHSGEVDGTVYSSWLIIGLDCPQLSPRAVQKLQAVIREGRGRRAHALLHWGDRGSQLERQRLLDLSSSLGCTTISWDSARTGFTWQEEGVQDCRLALDALPSDDIVGGILRPVAEVWQATQAEAAAERVTRRAPSVSFSDLLERSHLEDERNWWTKESTADFEGLLGLSVEGGEVGEPVVCRFGRGAEHALLAGVTGSGKNNLLNVLIATMALRYSPEELEFFLIDLKEGIEFQRFADSGLPHARVISLSNDPEFALNVLRGLDAEMEHRGRLFTGSGTTSIADYRNKTGKHLARILLVVDEAKTLYGGNDATFALAFFDKMAAKGRSFGLHLLLANQGFSGTSLRLSTIANMGIRLVTKGKGGRTAENVLEAGNPVLESLLQHEAVYNDGQGSKEHNHPCRVPQWTDTDDEYLRRLARRAPPGFRKPVVFRGHERPLLSSCSAYEGAAMPSAEEAAPRMWLGAPMSLEEAVSVEWKRESKQNLLIVDADEEEATGLLVAALAGLLATVSPEPEQFLLLDLGTARRSWSGALTSIRLGAGRRVAEIQREAALETLGRIATMVESRTNARMYDESPVFLVMNGIHRLRELQYVPAPLGARAGGSSPRTVNDSMGAILRDGPYVGVHTLVWCDTAENARRLLEPGKLRGEFGMVAAGRQADDTLSRALVGTGKAATVGVNRMVFANSGDDSGPCVFRPYALPEMAWLESLAGRHPVHTRP